MCLVVKLTLKNQIAEAIEEAYLGELNNPDEGFLAVEPEDMLQHLFDCYGIIAEPIIAENKINFEEPFDPTLPFVTFTRRIEKCRQTATDSGAPYSDAQLVQTGVMAIARTSLFNDGYLRWSRHPLVDKMWANFKTQFNQVYTEW